MKVQELIDALQSYPKDATILIDCEEYQDYDVDHEKDLRENRQEVIYGEM